MIYYLASALMLLVIVIGVFYQFKYSAYRTECQPKCKLNYLDYRIMFVITALYAVISLINIGSTTTHNNSWNSIDGGQDQLVISLAKATHLSNLYYYTGLSKSSYELSMLDESGNVINLQDKNTGWGFPIYFRWNKVPIESSVLVKKIIFNIKESPFDIRQIALFGKNGSYIPNVNILTTHDQDAAQKLITANPPQYYDDTWLSSTAFDELYYTSTGYQYWHGLNPYIMVHPPLVPLLIGGAMRVLGVSAFAWRIIPDLFSIALVPLMYLFAFKLFARRKLAIFAAILISCDFMHYTIGRIALLDGILTFFIVAEYYFLYLYASKRLMGHDLRSSYSELFWCGVFLGLSISSKLNGAFSILAIVAVLIYIELIYDKEHNVSIPYKTINLLVLLLITPITIYILTYVPYALIAKYDNLFSAFWNMQKYMIGSQLFGFNHATHPYASSWWEWPLLKKPMAIFYWNNNLPSNLSSSVVLMGNPLIYWLFFQMVGLLFYKAIRDKSNYVAWFILITILAQYLPYSMVTHISFLYYFYPVTPFAILGLVFLMGLAIDKGNTQLKYVVYLYIFAVIILFILFFPALSGITVPRDYTVKILLWQSGWNF